MTFCTSGQCIFKAGKGVDENFYSGSFVQTGEKGGAIVENLISGAESLINSAIRYNFSDNYTTLNQDTKLILQEVASNIVGIYMVQYNFASYTSRVEGEDIINVLRDATLRGLSILRDKKVQDFINAS